MLRWYKRLSAITGLRQTHDTGPQMAFCLQMIKKPVVNVERFERVWVNYACALKDAYEMNE